MAMTLQEVKALMDEAEIKSKIDEDKNLIVSTWGMDNYKDSDGHKGILVIVRLEEDGEYVKVFAPGVYKYKEGPNLVAVLEACMYSSWRTKMVQFEYDPSDGEIRAVIEFPLEDARLTAKQLRRMVSGLANILDDCDSIIRTAIDTGKFVPKDDTEKEAAGALLGALEGLEPDEIKTLIEEIKKRKKAGSEVKAPAESTDRPTEL
jgi:hypothetical protein